MNLKEHTGIFGLLAVGSIAVIYYLLKSGPVQTVENSNASQAAGGTYPAPPVALSSQIPAISYPPQPDYVFNLGTQDGGIPSLVPAPITMEPVGDSCCDTCDSDPSSLVTSQNYPPPVYAAGANGLASYNAKTGF